MSITEDKNILLKTFNTIEDVVIFINPDHTIDNINEHGIQLLKKKKSEIIGKKCYKEICGYNHPPHFCPLKNISNSESSEPIETYYKKFHKYFSLNATYILDEKGNIIKYIDIMRDIDSLKRSELTQKEQNEELEAQNEELQQQNEEIQSQKHRLQENKEEIATQNEELQSNIEEHNYLNDELQAEQARLKNAEELAGLGSWEFDLNTREVYFSAGFYRLFRVAPNTFAPNLDKLVSLVHPDDKEKLKKTLHEAINKNISYKIEHRIITGNREVHEVLSQGDIREDGNKRRLSGIMLDITGSKRIRNKLLTNNRRLISLTRIRENILHNFNEKQLLNDTCKIITESLHYSLVYIGYKVHNKNKDINIIASTGFERSYLKNFKITWGNDKYGNGPAGMSIKTGKPRLNHVGDKEFAPWSNKARTHNIKSIYCVPIFQKKKVIGVIAFYSLRNNTFNDNEIVFLQNIANDLSYGVETIRNNNKRIKIEKALRDNEESLSAIFENAPIIMILVDRNARILRVNHPGMIFSGKSKKNSVYFKFGEVYDCINNFDSPYGCGFNTRCGTCFIRNAIKKTFETGENQHKIEGKFVRLNNGEQKEYHLQVSTAFFAHQKPQAVLVSIDDIAQRKESEQKMKDALFKEKELNNIKSQFIYTVTHEFRTPLSSIYSNTQLLYRYTDKWSKEKRERSFNRIYGAVNTMSALLEDVSILGKEQSGQLQFNPEPLDLKEYVNSLVEEASEVYKDSPPIKTRYLLSNDSEVLVDATLLRHILTNVFTNALKYSAPNDKPIEFTIYNGSIKNSVVFSIKDFGRGIAHDELKNIYEPFYRGSNISTINGTGLGLSIVKKSVALHNGNITINSEKEKGTTVIIEIQINLNYS